MAPPETVVVSDARVETDEAWWARFVRAETAFPWLAAFAVACLAELASFVIAATWIEEHAWRFTLIAENPFARGEVGLVEHRMRILGPTISWLLGLPPLLGAYVVNWSANIPLLAVSFRLIRERSTPAVALLFTALLATTHVTMSSRTLIGYQDSLAFLCVVIAMYTRRPRWAAAVLFLGLFADQRLVLLVPFVVLWHALDGAGQRATMPWRLAVALGISVALWFAASAALSAYFGVGSKTASFAKQLLTGEHALHQVKLGYLHLGYWMALRAGWAAVAIGLFATVRRVGWASISILAALAGCALGAILVADVSRGASFAFPLMFVGAVEAARLEERSALVLLGTLLLVNLSCPSYQALNRGLWIVSYPLPLEILRSF